MKMQRFLSYGLALGSLLAGAAFGQSGDGPTVSNVRVETTAEQVIIRYDVAGLSPNDSVYVQIEGRTRGLLPVKTLAGDAGTDQTAGLNKVVVWYYRRDNETLDDEIQAKVNIKRFVEKTTTEKGPETSDTRRGVGGGPMNALLSAALPGLGNVMVQPNRRIRVQPAIALAYVGALVYGLSQKSKSNDQYALYRQQPYDRMAQPYYDAANRLHHRYILSVGAAALIWVADVTYVLLTGLRNDRLRKPAAGRLQPLMNYVGQRPAYGLRYQF